jgi:iron(III) transport system substrate-binding protein
MVVLSSEDGVSDARSISRPRVFGWLIATLAFVATGAALFWTRGDNDSVVIYTSQDLVYSEPILREFEQKSGIKVKPLYDSEAVKTVGLANRLIAEKSHPRCDVVWSNEELRTRQLESMGVFRESAPLTTFGYRSRRIVINTNLLSLADAPKTLAELTNSAWRGKVALAYPLFGTTATHFLALRQSWSPDAWEAWCAALQANQPFLVDGNSVVVKQVGRGEAWIGLTDSDDIAAGQREGLPIAGLPLTPEMLLIPNTIGIVRGGPNPAAAQKLHDFLASDEIAAKLVAANALEGADLATARSRALPPNWTTLLADLEPATEKLKAIFLR